MPRRLAAAATLLLLAATPRVAAAQVRASERGTVSQTLDGTTIALDYSRPVARGRDPLFGGVVHWGHMWTPGANWATTLDVSADVRLNGNALPKGKYSVWMIPRDSGDWTVVLNRNVQLFHTQPPTDGVDEQLRFDVAPQKGPRMETLSWYFPVVGPDAATLRMHWGETFVPIRVTVVPTRVITMRADRRRAYLGTYEMTFEPKFQAGPPVPIRVEVYEQGDTLRARLSGAPPGYDPEWDLLPSGARPGHEPRFHPAWYQDGKLFDVDLETTLVFQLVDGRATGFEMRGLDDVMARAVRDTADAGADGRR